jgi:putative flippase GtrA
MASIRQFSIFALVGLVCAFLDIATMQALILHEFHPVAAASFGFAVGLCANFLLHSRITFQAGRGQSEFLRFIAVVAVNYLITVACVGLSTMVIGEPLAGKLLSLPLVAINGFLLSKHWVFR